jgi:DNA excision repair protein ERCC-3
LLVTPGERREELAALARWCGQLRAVAGGSYIYAPTPLALWGAAARGVTAERLLNALAAEAATPVPAAFAARVSETIGRYGALRLESVGTGTVLTARDPSILSDLGLERSSAHHLPVAAGDEGRIKLLAAEAGWPVLDTRRSTRGRKLGFELQPEIQLRSYQREAVDAWRRLGSGVVLLPCGAGKTVVGVAAAAATGRATLVLVPARAIANQWREAFLRMTTLPTEQVRLVERGAQPAAISIATYQAAIGGALTGELADYPWGLVIYDEVQSLPADGFRLAAGLQTPRRLGLTAALVREDGRERDVFALVGPVVYDVPWVELELEGWIAPARCYEVRVPEPPDRAAWLRYRLAVLERLLHLHQDEQVLVAGSDLASLRAAARRFDLPLATGATPTERRQQLYDGFRSGATPVLALSKVGSVGLDFPNATVLIQLSGTFGSRQEEAQRLGRLLRPKPGKTAGFYTIVAGRREERFARRRQRFLVEQGYRYEIIDAADLPRT